MFHAFCRLVGLCLHIYRSLRMYSSPYHVLSTPMLSTAGWEVKFDYENRPLRQSKIPVIGLSIGLTQSAHHEVHASLLAKDYIRLPPFLQPST